MPFEKNCIRAPYKALALIMALQFDGTEKKLVMKSIKGITAWDISQIAVRHAIFVFNQKRPVWREKGGHRNIFAIQPCKAHMYSDPVGNAVGCKQRIFIEIVTTICLIY